MANFSAANKTLMHELLGLFQGSTFDWYDYTDRVTGQITSVPIHSQIDFKKATDRLAVIITALELETDDRKNRIDTVLAEYSDISLDVAEIRSGGGSGASGARYSPERHRRHLRKLLMTHLGIRVFVRSRGQGNLEGARRRIPYGRV